MEKNTGICIGVNEILYGVFFCLLFFAKGFGLYDGQPAFKLILVAAVLCLAAKCMTESYSVREIVIMGLILLICAVTYVTSGDKGLLLYAMMLAGMKNVNREYLLRAALVTWSVSFVLLWLVSMTHMGNTAYRVAGKLGMDHIFRWSMGYAHPNVLHISYLILAALILLVLGEGISRKWYLILAVGNLLVFLYSVSYTGVAIVFLLLIGRGYLQLRKKIGTVEKILLGAVFPACVLLSVAGPLILHGKVFRLLDRALNTRLTLAKHYLKPEYISLLGTRLSEITSSHWTMDNSYVFCLIAYGILPFAGVCGLYLYLTARLLKRDETTALLVILVLAAAGLTEPFLFNTAFKNITFVFIGQEIYADLSRRREREIGLRIGKSRKCTVDTKWLVRAGDRLRELSGGKKRAAAAGALAGAVLAAVIGFGAANLPEGYVVLRSRCEDIMEDIIIYEENAREYEGFKCVGNLKPGDEIQYFSGDIVRMERIRIAVMCALAGGAAGGVFVSVGLHRLRR